MQLVPSLLEDWLRQYYFTSKYDLGSSGVRNFSFQDLLDLTSFSLEDLKNLQFNDSETFGNYSLREAISHRFGNKDPETVLIGNGSNEVIYVIMNSLLSKGEEVIILNPIYYTLSNIAKSLNCKVKLWELDPNKNFSPDINKLKKLISSKTRMVIVNFPHNPTGVTLSEEDYRDLVETVSKVGAYLVWDAAFEDLVYDKNPLPNPYLSYEKTIYINTLTKCYGLAGLRLGWCIANPTILKKSEVLKDYMSLYVSPLNELIALHAIKNINRLLSVRLREAKTNRELLKDWIEKNQDYIKCSLPQGGVSSFVKIKSASNTEILCKTLATEKEVLLVPGICFGFPQYVRLGFGSANKCFEKGLNIISEYLNTIKPLS